MGKRSNTRKRKRWVDLIIGAIVGAVAGWALSPLLNEVWFSMFPTEPHFISYSTHRVELLDRTGSSIGVIKLDARVREALLADVNEDGKKEVVVGTDEGRIKPGYVMVFTAKGRTLWEFDTFEERIMTNLSGGHSDHFRISEIQIASLFGQGRKYIVAMAQDPTWFAARLIILDPRTAELVTSYWHPGQVGNMSVADIDNDGRSELVFCGVNNNLRHLFRTVKNIPVAFALSPEIGMNAQAFPGGSPGFLPFLGCGI